MIENKFLNLSVNGWGGHHAGRSFLVFLSCQKGCKKVAPRFSQKGERMVGNMNGMKSKW